MNRNYPKAMNDTPKWTSIKNTNLLKKPNYTTRSGKMVEVKYGLNQCRFYDKKITLACTYFVANKKHNRRPIRNKSLVENNTSSDNFYSNKHKLCTTAIGDDEQINHITGLDDNLKNINSVLEDLGFSSTFDDAYTRTVYPLKIKCFNVNKQFNTAYGSNSYTSTTLQNLTGNPDAYNQKERYQNSILYQKFPEKHYYNKNYIHYQKSITQNNTNLQQSIYTKKPNYYQQKPIPQKYWEMRYMLFSNFDQGIILDEESFYSVCPEILSYHIAKRCTNNIVVDPFCGAGGNVIQLAKTCKKVIAIDIDPEKIKLARHNAKICGVEDKIQFMVGDFFSIYRTIKADVLFMSPPWGGPGYAINKIYSLKSMCQNHFGGGFDIFKLAKTVAPNIAFHVPKNTDLSECLRLAQDFGKVEIQQNIINGKLNSITAFYGNFNWS
ncbi:uncharacterized protein LOC113555164 [Rhopalosiphum maidis]|uniref:uncharacterized protein LOC113555164 n=1 Tax=Rhopalosiphum maidis TaxID=43146 RepID=UPI000EFEC06D|nr:uncharacterized protein LOC113555164 [Rhopalosiphum maidis]